MLLTRSLFFARATLLGDPFEGSSPKANLAAWEHLRAHRVTDPQLEGWRQVTDEQLAKMIGGMSQFRREGVREYFVNCWHMNEHESAAIWRLYSQSDEAICVQSTFNRLAEVLPSYANVGAVRYLNYDTDPIDMSNGFNFKHPGSRHS
jgi:hypothetical protein